MLERVQRDLRQLECQKQETEHNVSGLTRQSEYIPWKAGILRGEIISTPE